MRHVGLLALTWTLFASACSTEENTLQIVSLLVPDDDCTLKPSGLSYSSGRYDPRIASQYGVFLRVRNTLEAPEDLVTAGGNGNANDAHVMGGDVCWFRADPEGGKGAAFYDQYANGVPDELQCDNLPDNQRTFVAGVTTVDAGGGEAAMRLYTLTHSDLQGAYGSNFNPTQIEDWGPYSRLYGGTEVWRYSLGASDPSNKGARDPDWGDFPGVESARLIVQVRLTGKLQSGGTVQSNWFVFPVDVCVGCSDRICGDPLLVACDPFPCTDGSVCNSGNACADGSFCVPQPTLCSDGNRCPPRPSCANGTLCTAKGECFDGSTCDTQPRCSDGSPCNPGIRGIVGNVVDWAETCNPAQAMIAECVEVDGCAE